MRYPTKDFVVAVLCAVFVACGDGPASPIVVPVASVAIGTVPPPLNIGANTTLSAETFNANGQPVRGRVIAWTTSNVAVVTVQEIGALG
ncbi:MAG: hypothetical protein ABI852_22130, partial [Gemmatimonadaceae bacterium]